jgi:isopenicillin-N N-acyltransferase-like protein
MIPTIEITATDSLNRGREYGEAARDQIQRSIAYYREAFERSAGLEWSEVCTRATAWIPLIEDYLPGILEEVRGIGEGAGVSFEEVLTLNARGELSHTNPFDPDPEEGCSSYSMLPEATGDGHVYCGQNWDWRADVAGTVVALRIVQPGKPTIICQVEAGQVGRHGANSAGIALNANGLGGRFGTGLGVPGTFVRRKILEAWDMHDALEAALHTKQAYSTNLLFTHRDGFSIDIETTPGRHGWMYPTDGLLVHANHFMSFVPPQMAETYRPFSVDSLYRVPRIEQILRRARQADDSATIRDLIQEALRDHFGHPNSVCNHPDPRRHSLDRHLTIVSSLVDLTAGDYYATLGAPCENPYDLLPWNIYDGPAAPDSAAGNPVAVAGGTGDCG